jgi:hypothetical protein
MPGVKNRGSGNINDVPASSALFQIIFKNPGLLYLIQIYQTAFPHTALPAERRATISAIFVK